MVVVLEAGSIIDMPSWLAKVPAVVMAWYPGMVGGTALARLLFGDANFSGKLPVTWDTTSAIGPRSPDSSGSTTMDYWIGYQYFDHNNTALTPPGSFPFGYGLSYTTFSYQNLQVPCSTVPSDGVVQRSKSTSTTRARWPARRRCSSSCSTPAHRSPIAPAITKS